MMRHIRSSASVGFFLGIPFLYGCDSNSTGPARSVIPGAPTSVVAHLGDREASVSWIPPEAGAPFTNFVVTSLEDTTKRCVASGANPFCLVIGLDNGTPYTFTVKAVNRVGMGPSSSPSQPVTPDSSARALHWSLYGTQGTGTIWDLYSGVWTGTQVVAVGQMGTIVTSRDGQHWTPRISGATSPLNSVAWTGSRLVIVGSSLPGKPRVFTSTDGVEWSPVDALGTAELRSVAWSGSQLIAVGDSGLILTSSDGLAWTARNSGVEKTLFSVAATETRIVAVGSDGTILTSVDGETWVRQSSGTTATFLCVITKGSGWAASGVGGLVATSPDAFSWSTDTTMLGGDYWCMAWNGSLLVVQGGYNTQYLLTSPDGKTWTSRSASSDSHMRGMIMAGPLLMAFGDGGAVSTSPDGITWAGGPNPRIALRSIAWSGHSFVAVGNMGTILTSPNGQDWAKIPLSTTATLRGVAWSGSQFVAVGDTAIMASTDGLTWTSHRPKRMRSLSDVIWAGDGFVAVGQGVYTSSDGVSWNSQPLSSDITGTFSSVAWSGTRFVAVGATDSNKPVIAVSNDGEIWTKQATTSIQRLNSVAWAGTEWVAVGAAGTILTSQDGIAWQEQAVAVGSNSLLSVTWTGSRIVTVGSGGTSFSSQDGKNWMASQTGTDATLFKVVPTGSGLMGVGDYGLFLRTL